MLESNKMFIGIVDKQLKHEKNLKWNMRFICIALQHKTHVFKRLKYNYTSGPRALSDDQIITGMKFPSAK